MTPHPLPRPPYVDDAWLRAHGVEDPEALLRGLRAEDEVMAPTALRAVKATRLSFARTLLRRMVQNRWVVERKLCEIDALGNGRVVYEIRAEGRTFHFAAASLASSGADRPGRFCEDEYDFLGSLLDGPMNLARVRRELDAITSKVWSGRTDNGSFGWTVANRSNRFFDHVVTRLVDGTRPDLAFLASGGGYIVRNAGWYGNGRHGSRSWLALEPGHPLGDPYHVDMLALYLWRLVGFDVAEAMAQSRSSGAATLDAGVRRALGIGNASGIGMVAALVRWPAWLSAFNYLRELALAYAFSRVVPASSPRVEALATMLDRAAGYYAQQPACPLAEIEDPVRLSAQLRRLGELTREYRAGGTIAERAPVHPWRTLSERAAGMGLEAREQLHSLLIDLESEFADAAADLLSAALAVPRTVEPHMTVGELTTLLRDRYAWALAIDLQAEGARAYFWYRSEENGENRRGEQGVDPGIEFQTFVDVAGAVQALHAALGEAPSRSSIGEFLLTRPELCHVVSRAQLAAKLPYTEIRANIVDRDFLPMDGIRFLLGTMGLESSHPHNTRWVRGVFLQGAPLPEDIASGTRDDWVFCADAVLTDARSGIDSTSTIA